MANLRKFTTYAPSRQPHLPKLRRYPHITHLHHRWKFRHCDIPLANGIHYLAVGSPSPSSPLPLSALVLVYVTYVCTTLLIHRQNSHPTHDTKNGAFWSTANLHNTLNTKYYTMHHNSYHHNILHLCLFIILITQNWLLHC